MRESEGTSIVSETIEKGEKGGLLIIIYYLLFISKLFSLKDNKLTLVVSGLHSVEVFWQFQ